MSEQSSQGSLNDMDETVVKLNIYVFVAPTAFSVGVINSVDPTPTYCVYVQQYKLNSLFQVLYIRHFS